MSRGMEISGAFLMDTLIVVKNFSFQTRLRLHS